MTVIVEYAILTRLEQISKALRKLNRRLNTMSVELDTLTTRVTAIEDAGDAAIALLTGLKAKLDEAIANNSMPAVRDLSNRIGAQTDELAAAIIANTPAEEPPVEEPPVV